MGNDGKIMGKSMINMGTWWENHGEMTYEWKLQQKIMGKIWDTPGPEWRFKRFLHENWGFDD